MEHRFESMMITPQDSTRIDAAVGAAQGEVDIADGAEGANGADAAAEATTMAAAS